MIVLLVTTIYSQHTVEEFYVYDGENIFYLQMLASEMYRILGAPIEDIKIIREHFHRPNYFIIRYPGIEFIYFDFSHRPGLEPEIVVITIREPYQISNLNVIGRNKDEILKYFGEPNTINTQDGYIYIYYNFRLEMPNHLVLQFRFNAMRICVEVSVIHSHFYI